MRLVRRTAALVRALFRNDRIEADLAEEMRFHMERDVEASVARGMAPEAAWRDARRRFGSVDRAREQARDERPGSLLRELWGDLRFGARLLRKSPVFGVAGVAIIALGVGAATAVFGVVHGVLLRPLPYREPERLVSIWMQHGRTFPTAADAEALRARSGTFAGVAYARSSNANLTLVGEGAPLRFQTARVSPNLFSVLGVAPALGRAFLAGEDAAGAAGAIVLSDAAWRGRFGADPSIVGRTIRLSGTSYTVVGVMPATVQYPTASVDAWIPAVLEPGELARERINNYRLVARLAPGATLERARREAAAIEAQMAPTDRTRPDRGFSVDSMLDDAVREVRPALQLLLGAVSLLLLTACVNLAMLFGARAAARRGEFATRLALGASRRRLVTQAVAEAAPVLAAGGSLGVLVAAWAVQALVAAAPAGFPRVESIGVSGPVLLWALALLALTGVAASVAPAAQAWRSDFTSVAKDGGRGNTRRGGAARRLGAAAQFALALPLLAGAALLLQSALAVSRVDVGFRPEGVASFLFEVSRATHRTDEDVARYYARVVEAVRAVPGVSHAAIGNRAPLIGAQSNPVRFEGATVPLDETVDVDSRTVTPDYFAALGIPLLAGRTFGEQDDADAPVVGVIDERLARTMWPSQSPIGRRFQGPDDRWGTVVGVVGHTRTTGVEVDPRPQVYWSTRQWTQNRAVLVVRTSGDPRALFASVAAAVHGIDPEQSLFDVRTFTDVVERSLAQRRVTTALMVGFGALALLLAAVGIYGVVAYGVAQRLREFGIRVALGATRRDVTRLVVGQGARTALAGSAVGLALAFVAAGAAQGLVYGVPPRDVRSLLGAAGVLLLVAVLACWGPARRAASVDAGVTLRAE
ncbi:MAG: ADOP family duplicated permease [Gemmatimonadaceae bacterium]